MQEKAPPPPLTGDERERYEYPQVRVIGPGGPYFKLPWQKAHKVSVATQAVDLSWDPSKAQDTIEAVTKDNLTTGVNGQIRYRISENNLYAYLFGVSSPLEHVMGYFVSVLRERIANFVDPKGHSLSRTVRQAVSPLSEKWGYRLGSVYIRRVAFTDVHMVRNITEKVVKRVSFGDIHFFWGHPLFLCVEPDALSVNQGAATRRTSCVATPRNP